MIQLFNLEIISLYLTLSLKFLFVFRNMSLLQKPSVNNPNRFFYRYGNFCLQKQRKKIAEFVIKTYEANFRRKLAQKNKYEVLNIVCKPCVEPLQCWSQERGKGLQFGVLMIWTETTNHLNDCYFCAVTVKDINQYKKRTSLYPNVELVKPPVLHNDDLPILVFSGPSTANCDDVEMFRGIRQSDELQ